MGLDVIRRLFDLKKGTEATSGLEHRSGVSQSFSMPASRGANRGIVELELTDEQGNVLDYKVVRNTLSYEYRNQLSSWLSGSSDFVLPTHIAAGTGSADTSISIKTIQTMSTEVVRNTFSESAVTGSGVRFRAIFKANDFAADVKELMLFSEDALTVTLDNCNSATGWSTGVDQSLNVDSSERREGTGSLSASASGINPDSRTFYSTRIGINLPSSAVGVNISSASDYFQAWLYVSDKTKMTADGSIVLSSSTISSTNQWSWALTTATLANGWNHLQMAFSSASITGTPDMTNVVRCEVVAPKDDPVVFKLDRLRTYKANGLSFARTEFTSAFSKQIGAVLNVTWTILPDYEDKMNTFLWTADNTVSAVAADVTANLTQSGSGTFPAATSHPYGHAYHWLPAASGYMTVFNGNRAVDTDQGSIAMWIRYPATGTASPANCELFDYRNDANNVIQLVRDGSDASFTFNYKKGGTTKTVSVADTKTDNAYRFVVARWDNTQISLSVGTATPTNAGMTNADILFEITNQPTIGGRSGGTTTNCKIGPVMVFSQALSTAEIVNLYNLGRKYRYGEAP